MTEWGERSYRLRKALGTRSLPLSRREFSILVGYSPGAIFSWESGGREPVGLRRVELEKRFAELEGQQP